MKLFDEVFSSSTMHQVPIQQHFFASGLIYAVFREGFT